MPFLDAQLDAIDAALPYRVVGSVQAVSGLTIEAADLPLPLGAMCRIDSLGGRSATAEVIGFQHDRTLLMPLTATAGVARGDRIENVAAGPRIGCSDQLLGRVIDGLGRPIDGKGAVWSREFRRIDAPSVRPMDRQNIRQPIATSVRAIDALHTCGLGQRMGIFSGPGRRQEHADVVASPRTPAPTFPSIALIGERGREVQEFLTQEPRAGRHVEGASSSSAPATTRRRSACARRRSRRRSPNTSATSASTSCC